MSISEPIKTYPIEQFINAVKSADAGRAKELKMDIQTAKTLAFTLGVVMARMNGDLEKFVKEHASNNDEVIQVQLGGGNF